MKMSPFKAKCYICGRDFQSRRKKKTGFCSLTCSTIAFSNHLIVFAFIFSFLYFFVEDLLTFFLGEKWAIAGSYAKTMLPLFFIIFVVSPLTLVNPVNLKNRLGMFWQIGLLALNCILLYLAEIFDIVTKYLCQPVLIITMSFGWILGSAFSRSSGMIFSHLPLGMETTTAVPKKRSRGTSSIKGVPSITCAGASVWVVQCMKVVICCESTLDFA